MSADGCWQYLLAGIADLERHRETPVMQGIGDGKPEREGIASPRLGVVSENKPARPRLALLPCEPAVPCKAVLRHRVGCAAMAQLVALEPAHDRKQQRCVPL